MNINKALMRNSTYLTEAKREDGYVSWDRIFNEAFGVNLREESKVID